MDATNVTIWSIYVAIATFLTLMDRSKRSIWNVAFTTFRSAKWTVAFVKLQRR